MKIDRRLITWYNEHKRDLPWRETTNPYLVWLSEIILQQTRVAQGLDYYLRFAQTYPRVSDLASAPLDDVLKLWEGLGYYSRARNLHAGAKQIMQEFEGQFPSTYEEIITIKGIGPYTAAAISSFCFGEKQAVLDGNVFRLLARLYGINTPINSTAGKKVFQKLADEAISFTEDPGTHNQAIMEFGALQCTPKNLDCNQCPFASDCVAHTTGQTQNLPVKLKSKPQRHRYFNYFVIEKNQEVLVNQRENGDIWSHLYEFPLLELEAPVNQPNALIRRFSEVNVKLERSAGPIQHVLSHQKLHINFWRVNQLPEGLDNNGKFVPIKQLKQLAFPIVIKRFVEANLLPLPPRL